MQSRTSHSPQKDAQTLSGSTHSLHMCFSHIAVTPCLSLWTGDTRLELLMLARPICSTHWGLCFLQGAFEHLDICRGGLEGMVRTVPQLVLPVTGVFLLDCYQKDVSTQSTVCCSKCSLSYQLQFSSTQTHDDAMIYHETERSIKGLL